MIVPILSSRWRERMFVSIPTNLLQSSWLSQTQPELQGCALLAPGDPWHLTFFTFLFCFFHKKHMLGTLDFTISEHWAPFNFVQELSLVLFQFVLSFPSASFVSCPSFSHDDGSHLNKDHVITISFFQSS